MNFFTRPSKCFLFDILESKLKSIESEIGLDAGSSNFKNRRWFKTKKYYGLDINLDSLKNGLAKYNPDPRAFGLCADVTKLKTLPANSVDLIVSTNTLYALPPSDRLSAIQQLADLTAPNGRFICEFSLKNDSNLIINLLKNKFDQIKIIYYKNIISYCYEKIFERQGFLGHHPIASSRPMRLFAWLLSRLEFISCHFKTGNQQIIIDCNHKKTPPNSKQNFDLSKFELINSRIYQIH